MGGEEKEELSYVANPHSPHNHRVTASPMFISPTEMGSPVGLFHLPLTSNLLSGVM